MGQIDKIANLIKKTGDKAIILDQNGNPSCVLMSLSDYEKLVFGRSELAGLTEDELLDKINRDIAIWKDIHEDERLPIDQYDFSQDLDKNDDFGSFTSFNDIPSPIKNDYFSLNSAKSGEEEENRYYFEPVE